MRNPIIIKILLLVFPLVLLTSCNKSSSPKITPIVQTSVGSVQGIVRTYNIPSTSKTSPTEVSSYRVNEYRGIPYALPPTGDLRWALPQPVASLGSGVFKAYEFGTPCPQNPRAGSPEASSNEDCLSINVTTPFDMKPGEKLPVFFWIHGGAFVGGSSNLYRLDKLAHDGRMVVVSSNYRLGSLGFAPHKAFALNGYNGNYGLEDQRLAMKWVQDNITAFGGDKNNVTIAGESAGAGSVCMHLASPEQVVSQSEIKVKSLFHKAITQSGGCLQALPTVSQGETKVAAFIQAALCPDSQYRNNADILACMRRQSTKEIMAQQEIYTTANAMDVTAISPVVGGNTAPLSFKEAAALDKLVNVPMIMGGTKSELVLYVGYFWQDSQKTKEPGPPINPLTIKKWLGSFYVNPAPAGGIEAILKQYPKLLSSDSNEVAQTYGEVLSDYNPQLGINNCLFLHSSDTILRTKTRSNPIYQFEFADANAPVCNVSIGTPCPPFRMGPVHSSELNYLFPNLSFTSKIDGPELPPASQVLANQMVAYWSTFAHTGSPNRSDLPQWSEYTGATVAFGGDSVLLLEPNNVKPYSSDSQHSCSAFWKKQYPSKL